MNTQDLATLVLSIAVAGPAIACAGSKPKKSHDQWVEDCVYERTLPRDQCEELWEQAHTKK